VTRLKIASWNINSVRARVAIVERFLTEEQPDILCLQETKVEDKTFPGDLFDRLGYRHRKLHGQRMHHGVAILSRFGSLPPGTDYAVVALAIIGSLMNTFIKPVVYAEIGYREKVDGKIDDPLEGVGFFGRPETFIVLVLGGVTGYIGISVIIIALCTNLSAIQRIIYLYRTLS
jgi:hypothetical protein